MRARENDRACGSWTASEAIAAGLSALSHPVRLEILKQLSGAEACCCKDIVGQVDLAQSTVSQHLKILVDAGLVRFATDRQRSRYEINREALSNLSGRLVDFVDTCATTDPLGTGAKSRATQSADLQPE